MLSYLRAYCSLMPNILAFTTPDESGFGVWYVKCQIFGICHVPSFYLGSGRDNMGKSY